jgi:hypothetical protein
MTARRRRREAGTLSDLTVADGRDTLGRVIYQGGDSWRAELADGAVIGVFECRSDAREALGDAIRARRSAA